MTKVILIENYIMLLDQLSGMNEESPHLMSKMVASKFSNEPITEVGQSMESGVNFKLGPSLGSNYLDQNKKKSYDNTSMDHSPGKNHMQSVLQHSDH